MAVDGTYKVTTRSAMGVQDGELTLATDGDKLTGKVMVMGMEVELQNGKAMEDSFEGTIEGDSPMGKMTMKVTGNVDGDKIKGTLQAKMGGAMFDGTRI